MMKKILVAYATMAGSTADVARAVADEISKSGVHVDVLPLKDVRGLDSYDGVVVGAPMIMGWHRDAQKFLKKNKDVFRRIPFAVFVMAMSLTQTEEVNAGDSLIFVDPDLPKPPVNEAKPSFRERYATISNYLKPVFQATHPVKPASIGFFGGRLDYGRLKWWAVLFAMLIIQAQAGEHRNWEAIQVWAAGIPEAFHLLELEAEAAT
jgi:menaquinone-dependent protoporphyrinogen oxidase